MRTTVVRNFKAFLACVLCLSCVFALLQPSLLLAGGAGGVATEETQYENWKLLGDTEDKLEEHLGAMLDHLQKQIELVNTALKTYENAINMASKFTVLDYLGLSNFINHVRSVVKSAIGLYDTIDNLDEVLESAFEGAEKNFFDIGYDNIRDFARERKARYLKDVYDELKRGTKCLEELKDDIIPQAEKNKEVIAKTESYADFLKMIANLTNETEMETAKMRLAIEKFASAIAEKNAQILELEIQKDKIYEYWIEYIFQQGATYKVAPTSNYMSSEF